MDPTKVFSKPEIYQMMLDQIEKSGLGEVLRTGKGYDKLPRDKFGYVSAVDDVQSLMGHEFARRNSGLPLEYGAINSYKGPDYRYINAVKRGTSNPKFGEPTEFHQKEADLLEQLLEQGVDLPYDIVVHRGLGKADGGISEFFAQRSKGDEIGNLGFLSTTIDPAIAEDFTSTMDPVKAILEIPAGEKFIPVPGIERELLFKPKRTFEVLEIDPYKRSLRAKLKPGKIWSDTRNDRGRLIGGGALGALLMNEGDDDGE